MCLLLAGQVLSAAFTVVVSLETPKAAGALEALVEEVKEGVVGEVREEVTGEAMEEATAKPKE